MSFFEMETFLEKHIEGFFNRKFASDLQFAEIQKNVVHIIERNKKEINGLLFVPNYYEIQMSVKDFERICSRKSKEMLYEYIIRTIMRKNLFIDGCLNIKFCKSGIMKKGGCNITAEYVLDKDKANDDNDSVTESTIVIEKPTLKEKAAMPSEHFYASLTVIEGDDIDTQLDIGERQIHIGRREENEFLLTDQNASRLHAYIAFEKYRHILYDANSLNGTSVNGKKITAVCLNDGDVIDIGQTQLIYEVL